MTPRPPRPATSSTKGEDTSSGADNAVQTKKIKIDGPSPSPKPYQSTASTHHHVKNGPDRALESKNLIRETIAQLVSQHGAPSLDLSVGDPTRFGGAFGVPSPLRESIIDVINEGKFDGYTHSVGDEGTRRAIAKHYGMADFAHVAVTSGCSSALDITLRSLAGHEDIVLTPAPGFPLYETLLKLNGIGFSRYPLRPDSDWEVDLDALRSMANRDKVRAVIVCNPSNPTGSVYSESHLREILLTVKETFPHAVVIADQVYEDVVFNLDSSFVDMGKLAQSNEIDVPVVAVSGLAKGYHAPGWRMGWILSFDSSTVKLNDFRRRVHNISNTTMGASTIIQHAFRRVLEFRQEDMKAFRTRTDQVLRESCAILCKGLSKIPGVQVSEPKGAMYLYFKFPPLSFQASSSTDIESTSSSYPICVGLLKQEKLLLLPGDECFGGGAATKGYCRALLAIPPDVARDAVERITRFCRANCAGC